MKLFGFGRDSNNVCPIREHKLENVKAFFNIFKDDDGNDKAITEIFCKYPA